MDVHLTLGQTLAVGILSALGVCGLLFVGLSFWSTEDEDKSGAWSIAFVYVLAVVAFTVGWLIRGLFIE